jgi:uncharacterized membrane protein
MKIGDFTIPRLELVIPIAAIIVTVLAGIPVLGWLVGVVFLCLAFMQYICYLNYMYQTKQFYIPFLVQ